MAFTDEDANDVIRIAIVNGQGGKELQVPPHDENELKRRAAIELVNKTSHRSLVIDQIETGPQGGLRVVGRIMDPDTFGNPVNRIFENHYSKREFEAMQERIRLRENPNQNVLYKREREP